MAFLDHVVLNIKAGKGGDGVVRWRHEKAIAMGGPAGGDGGRGGDVYVVGQRNMHTLHVYAQEKDFNAENGEPGGSNKMHGASGEDLYLYFPLGTQLYVKEYDRTIDLIEEGQKELLFRGGFGGLGNVHFKSSTNRSPEEFTLGKKGEYGTVVVDLKMIADVGFIGFPNVGKSNLLNTLTKAQSKVGNYNFTTLEPHLGDYHGFILADIPGLIEGAAEGKGLGVKFLKHVERTGLLVHMIDAKEKDFVKAYNTIRNELEKFNPELLNKKEILVVSKIDNVYEKVKDVLNGKIDLPKLKKPLLKLLKKMTKEEIKFAKEVYKEETAKWKEETKKQKEVAAKFKKFISNVIKLEKATKKKVMLLSLYEDKCVKDFEKVLLKSLK